MAGKFAGYGGAKTWIIILVLLLVLFNFIAFVIYQKSHWAPTVWAYMWQYGDSVVFRVLTVSFILPILLLVMQVLFNIRGAIEERISKEKEALHLKRLECIDRTKETWNELYDLVTEVRHLSGDGNAADVARHTLIRMENLANRGEEVVNMWRLRFGLPEEHEQVLLTFINTLLHAAATVAHPISRGDEVEEWQDLQNCLGVIQEWIKTVAHHKMIMVLEHWAEVLWLKDTLGSPEEIHAKTQVVEEDMKPLTTWAQYLWVEEIESGLLPGIGDPAVKLLREKAKIVRDWLVLNPSARINDCPEFLTLEQAFENIPQQMLLLSRSIPYPKTLVRELAKWFAFESMGYSLDGQAKQLRTIAGAKSDLPSARSSENGIPEG